MADLEARKLNWVNFKLISQMVSDSGMAGRVPGYIGNIKKKQKYYFYFLCGCDILIFMCLYACLLVFEHISVFLCISSQYHTKINRGKK